MNIDKKIDWLIEHYRSDLSIAWWYKDEQRTHAIYTREEKNWRKQQIKKVVSELESEKAPEMSQLTNFVMHRFGRPISQLSSEERRIVLEKSKMMFAA